MDDRPSWDAYFLQIAFAVSTRSTCDRRHVGAVAVRERQILSTGYNGAPRGQPHCDDEGHIMRDGHCVRTSHAEMNAIAQAALHGVSIRNATIYSTDTPCLICTKLIINAGIQRIVFARRYADEIADAMLASSGIEVDPMSLDGDDLLRLEQKIGAAPAVDR